jgi:hypothetical protein
MKLEQQLILRFYEQMLLCFDGLSDREKSELQEFEKKRPTSEWPGWKERIGESLNDKSA